MGRSAPAHLGMFMIDFHTHVLPMMDDGSDSIETSLEMLRLSKAQGVDAVVATPHFYANDEYPGDFLRRRDRSLQQLQEAMAQSGEAYPQLLVGAEVLYFPGIGDAEEIPQLKIQGTNAILVEPPMAPWRDSMLDEIASLAGHGCQPVIAHVDRYMRLLGEDDLIDRALDRGMLVQVNASYFLYHKTQRAAFRNLKKGKIHVIGSDCHDLESRAPNLMEAEKAAQSHRLASEFAQLTENTARILGLKGILP